MDTIFIKANKYVLFPPPQNSIPTQFPGLNLPYGPFPVKFKFKFNDYLYLSKNFNKYFLNKIQTLPGN